jgi:hypothetical protein
MKFFRFLINKFLYFFLRSNAIKKRKKEKGKKENKVLELELELELGTVVDDTICFK